MLGAELMLPKALGWASGVLSAPSSAAHGLCSFGQILLCGPHPYDLLSRAVTPLPRRVDVLVMTPWFAPIIWDGTFDSAILDAQFRDTTIGLTVFAIKK